MLLEISTSMICPLACSYCPQEAAKQAYKGPRLMSVETLAAALANCPPQVPISFAGLAEPFLNRDCSALMAHAIASGHAVQLYTTGQFMNDSDVEFVIRVQPYRLVLHLPDAAGDMKANVDDAYAGRMRRLLEGVSHATAVCYGRLHEKLEFARPRLRSYGLKSRAGNVTHLAQVAHRGPLRCGAAPLLDNNVLLPSGELLNCCCDYALVHVLGDLTKQTWDEIHRGPQIESLRFLMGSNDEPCICRRCEYAVPA